MYLLKIGPRAKSGPAADYCIFSKLFLGTWKLVLFYLYLNFMEINAIETRFEVIGKTMPDKGSNDVPMFQHLQFVGNSDVESTKKNLSLFLNSKPLENERNRKKLSQSRQSRNKLKTNSEFGDGEFHPNNVFYFKEKPENHFSENLTLLEHGTKQN